MVTASLTPLADSPFARIQVVSSAVVLVSNSTVATPSASVEVGFEPGNDPVVGISTEPSAWDSAHDTDRPATFTSLLYMSCA
ncbi:unannotated protein [freshwater metagenome]|uniref:Unannotated protein n=1 Tax=freshwater metagenome TaxID=449393 RepID=A0A6J5ZN64_9ZZZZ